MGNLVITIGRTFGSGGREIGKMFAQEMGMSYYDKELLEEVAQYSGINYEYLAAMDEKKNSIFFTPFPPAILDQASLSDNRIIQMQREVVNKLVDKGPCVFVGRRIDQLLRGRANTFNIFISASLPYCVQRVSKRDCISEQESEKKIYQMNRSRRAYYNYTGDGNWGEASNYHLCLDSGVLGVDKAVKLLKTYIELNNQI